jgi:FkbM family methyltransferase
MLTKLRRYLWEFARCTRHNLLHMRVFRVTYRRDGLWHVRGGGAGDMVFPYYPYLAFHDIEGYIQHGAWRIEPGMTVLDVGGCYGEFALYALKCVGPTGRVIMIEPDASNIEVARRTFALNGNPPNLQIFQGGLWNRPGTLRFNTGQGPVSSVVGIGGDDGGDATAAGDTVEVNVESLPSLAQRLNIERVDFVKMDVEGAELEVIAAAGELPAKHKPRYAIASYHIVNGKQTAEVLPGEFAKIGYESRTGNARHLTTWCWPAGVRT